RRRRPRPCVLRIEAERALYDVDDFGDPAIPALHHDALGVRLCDASLLRDELHGLRLENLERLVEVFIVAEGEPMRRRLDARPFERSAFDHVDGDVDLPERGLDAGEVYLAIALRGMRIARPQQRPLHEHGHVKGRPGGQLTQVQIAAVTSWRDGAVASGLGARDAKDSGERPQRNENT